MKKEIVIIILLFALSGVNLWLNLRKDERQTTEINYDLYRYKSQQLQERIDSLESQISIYKVSIDSIKIKIINDESKIDHASNNDVDSMFSALFNRR